MSAPAEDRQQPNLRSLLGPEAPDADIHVGKPAESAGGPQAVRVASAAVAERAEPPRARAP